MNSEKVKGLVCTDAASIIESSMRGVLFAVEEAIRNGDCPRAVEQAFEEYETARQQEYK